MIKRSDRAPALFKRLSALVRLPQKTMLMKVAFVGVSLTALTVVKTYPLIRHFDTQLPGALGDPVLVTWILAWGSHALITDPLNLFNANIFYPVQNTLALSEHMIAVVPIFAPVYLLTGNPVVAYNSVFFLSFILCGMAMFLLVYYWTKSLWASLLAGCLFAFAPIRFAEIYHLQLYNFYWAPLSFLFLEQFLSGKRWGHLACFAICYWLQMLSSVYLGWFTTIALGVYWCYRAFYLDRNLLSRTMVRRYAAFIAASLIILLPFHVPYYVLQQQWGFSTSLQECVDWSADLVLNYLGLPPLFNDFYLSLVQEYFPRLLHPQNQQLLFPGLVLSFLVVVGSFPVAKCPPADIARHPRRYFGLVLVVAWLLSLGPFLVILGKNTGVPLPYLLLYYLVPGFHAIRVPGRFALMAVLAASVLAALGFLKISDFLQRHWGLTRRWAHQFHGLLALFCMAMFLLELGFKPLPLASIPTGEQVAPVYRWLATDEINGPIVEVPLGQDFWQALKYMYFSTYHWRPIVNGASRFLPPTHARLNAEIAALPSRRAAEFLSAVGVKGLVLHSDQLAPHEALRWQHADLAEIGLEEVARFGADVVYKFSPIVQRTSDLHVEFAVPNQLPNGEMIQLPQEAMLSLRLHAQSQGHPLWIHPPPLGRTPAVLEWKEQHSGKMLTQKQTLELPFAIRAAEGWSTSLAVQTPPSQGRYALRLRLPALGLEAAPKLMQITSSRYPACANVPQRLSAAYVLEEPSSQAVNAGAFHLMLQAINTGEAVWLARAHHDRGAIRLGWRWFKDDERIPVLEGREYLHYDVFPGQSYRFTRAMKTPSLESGHYTLELGLVCELVTWFSDQGVTPVTLDVHVQNLGRSFPP
jgi:hypothetical protein